jgi:hypothetical protein
VTNVVDRFTPFQRTTDEETKPVPFTVSVNGSPPETPDAGESELIVGTGFGGVVTVTAGLVAARVNPLLRNSLNSYVPAVEGIVTVHVRVVTPVPTYVQFVYCVFDALVEANASQSPGLPKP